jgi:hypothetical protein
MTDRDTWDADECPNSQCGGWLVQRSDTLVECGTCDREFVPTTNRTMHRLRRPHDGSIIVEKEQ